MKFRWLNCGGGGGGGGGGVMVLNATFNNYQDILWRFYWWQKPKYRE